MSPHPFFAVVLATYGRGHHIRPTIVSVLQQTCADFELTGDLRKLGVAVADMVIDPP